MSTYRSDKCDRQDGCLRAALAVAELWGFIPGIHPGDPLR